VRQFFSLRRLAAAALLVLVAAGLMAAPPLRTLARQIMVYFMPAAGDYRSVQFTVPATAGPGGSGTPGTIPLTLPEAEAAAGYPVREIDPLPAWLVFTGAHYEPATQAVKLQYSGENQTLLLTQRPAGGIEEFSSIGASAPVETIVVREFAGEYVAGGWVVAPGSSQALQTAAPGTQVSLGITWDASLPQHILRWQENGMLYEILSSGEKLKKDDLLKIAESIK
jgi:hypothetical protein